MTCVTPSICPGARLRPLCGSNRSEKDFVTATWNVSSEIGDPVGFEMEECIWISVGALAGRVMVQRIFSGELVTVMVFEGAGGSADAKVHSSSAGAACVCTGGGGEAKPESRSVDPACGAGGWEIDCWNWKGEALRGVFETPLPRAAKGSGFGACGGGCVENVVVDCGLEGLLEDNPERVLNALGCGWACNG